MIQFIKRFFCDHAFEYCGEKFTTENHHPVFTYVMTHQPICCRKCGKEDSIQVYYSFED